MEAQRAAVGEEGLEPDEVREGALSKLIDDRSSRRRFLRAVGGTAGASALATLAAACGRQKPIGITQRKAGSVGAFGPGDGGIVNYALFLEYIEGDFYDRAVKGDEVPARMKEFFRQVRQNEAEHRNALDHIADQLGRPLQQPKTRFESVFRRGPQAVLRFAATLENLGSAAYLGQADRIVDRQLLASALSIHSVEARQAAAFNELAGREFRGGDQLKGSFPTGAFAQSMTMEQVLARVRPYYVGNIPNLRPPIA